jgi:hypothetical protein
MTQQEKNQIKEAKMKYKYALKHRDVYKIQRDEILNAIITSPTPNWGSLIIKVTYI